MLKKLPILLLLVLFALPLFTQINVATAKNNKSPLTAPLTSFSLIGKVTLKQLGKMFGGGQRVNPAKNVKIEAVNFWDNNKKYTAITDQNGVYSLNLPNGLYKVNVDEDDDIFFTPPFRVVKVKGSSESAKTANFQGLVWSN